LLLTCIFLVAQTRAYTIVTDAAQLHCWSRIHTGFIVAIAALLGCAVVVWPVSTWHWRTATVAFQFVALLGVVYLPLRAPRRGGEDAAGAAAAAQLYTLLAGASAAVYWLQLLRVTGSIAADASSPAAALASLASLARSANGAVRFLAMDLGGLCLAALLFVALEEGRASSALPRLVLWSLLLSPGAALGLYLSAREGRLAAHKAGGGGSGGAAREQSSGDTSDEGASEGAAAAGASPARRTRRVRKAQ
jgi:hypothetical protein